MNNTLTSTSMQQQHNVITQSQPQVSENLSQSPPAAAEIIYLQPHRQMPPLQPLSQLVVNAHPQQITTEMGRTQSATTALFEPQQLQAANIVEKSFYTEHAIVDNNTVATNDPSAHFFTTSNPVLPHPNILISNNYAKQPLSTVHQQLSHHNSFSETAGSANFHNNNIRIVTTTHGPQQQHVCNITTNIGKDSCQLQGADTLAVQQLSDAHPQHLHQVVQPHPQFTNHHSDLPTLVPLDSTQHFSQTQFASQIQHALQQLNLPNTQSVYVPAEATVTNTAKVMPTMAPNALSTVVSAITAPVASPQSVATTTASSSSPVVLDRINICINNHYTDSTSTCNGISSPASANTLSTVVQLPSPIIPAIQHKAVVDSGNVLLIDSSSSSNDSVLVIDEPDSTTATPHTPPTTPENTIIAQPSHMTEICTKHSYAGVVDMTEETLCATSYESEDHHRVATTTHSTIFEMTSAQQPIGMSPMQQVVPLTPPTPPPVDIFNIGEDVFIKRQDGRFYLGTIIDNARQLFLIRFDDKSQLWCSGDELRKLTGGPAADSHQEGPRCVACKKFQNAEIVEICERCGRGYHRKCTAETSAGSGKWLCKRCGKPMKLLSNTNKEAKQSTVCHQFQQFNYDCRIEDDEKFTSDDEIPIKHILDKEKKNKTALTAAQDLIKLSAEKSTIDLVKIEVDIDEVDSSHPLTEESPMNTDTQETPKMEHVKQPEKENIKELDFFDTNSTTEKAKPSEKRSRKRKAFHSSSDENSNSSRCTSLDLIIPPPKNFLGYNNPFRIESPKKNLDFVGGQKSVSFGRTDSLIKNSIFNTTTLDFSSKLAALKSAGMFPNLSTNNLAKAAAQLKTVRAIKRRLSAKDIMIGPNQEVRRRRTRRLSSNVEVISTTTINTIPSNFFPIHAKDIFSSAALTTNNKHQQNNHQLPPFSSSSSASSSPPASVSSSVDSVVSRKREQDKQPTHGRRLRQRFQKTSPSNSRRGSISGAVTSATQSNTFAVAAFQSSMTSTRRSAMLELKQSVNKYFGTTNRIESGERYSIRAKRHLSSGQMQYLVEWGDTMFTNNTAP